MSDQPNIIVLGASARAAAFSALRAGLRPYAIDLFTDSDLVDVCPAVKIQRYPQDFEHALAAAPQAPWIYTGGLENYPDLLERMSALRPLYGNGADVLRIIRNPVLLAACLADLGIETPKVRIAPPRPGSKQEWLRKPRRSSGGLGIRRAENVAHEANEDRYFYQQFVPGLSRSAVYFASRGGCELLGVTEQQSGVSELPEEPFLYSGSSISLSHGCDAELMALGNVLAQEFRLLGLFNLDFIDDGHRIWPLEINPRYSASVEVLEHSQGKNFLTMHVAAFDPDFQGEGNCRLSKCPRHVAKKVIYATCDCMVTPEMERLRRAWNVERLLPCLADIPRCGDRILRGQPVATVIADGTSDEEVQRLLEERAKAVKQTLS